MTVNEIIREALIRIENEHGVAITGLRAEWIEHGSASGIRQALSHEIEIEAKVGDKE